MKYREHNFLIQLNNLVVPVETRLSFVTWIDLIDGNKVADEYLSYAVSAYTEEQRTYLEPILEKPLTDRPFNGVVHFVKEFTDSVCVTLSDDRLPYAYQSWQGNVRSQPEPLPMFNYLMFLIRQHQEFDKHIVYHSIVNKFQERGAPKHVEVNSNGIMLQYHDYLFMPEPNGQFHS